MAKNLRRYQWSLFRWGLVLAWMAVIFWFSSRPVVVITLATDTGDFLIKKTAHIGEYTILCLLLWNALERKNRIQTAFLIGLLYAFSDELHQLFTPGRTGMLRDVLTFDTLGLFLGAVIADKLSRWKKR